MGCATTYLFVIGGETAEIDRVLQDSCKGATMRSLLGCLKVKEKKEGGWEQG
jgi:hypothetical protein